MNREGGKYKLVLYKFRECITNKEHTMSLSHLLWEYLKVIGYFVLIEEMGSTNQTLQPLTKNTTKLEWFTE